MKIANSQNSVFNPLNGELNPICHLLALLETHHIFHVSELRVKNPQSLKIVAINMVNNGCHLCSNHFPD